MTLLRTNCYKIMSTNFLLILKKAIQSEIHIQQKQRDVIVCNQCLLQLQLDVPIMLSQGLLDTTLCYKVCLLLAAGRCFSLGTLVSCTNKTDHHDIAEILLKVALNTIALTLTLNKNSVLIGRFWSMNIKHHPGKFYD